MASNKLIPYGTLVTVIVTGVLCVQGVDLFLRYRVLKLYGRGKWGYWKKSRAKEPKVWILTK